MKEGLNRFRVPGDILSTNAENLRSQIFSVLEEAYKADWQLRCFEIDLRAARMVDSMGLNLLVSVIKSVGNHGGRVRFVIGNKNVERTFRFTRLNLQAEIVDQLAD